MSLATKLRGAKEVWQFDNRLWLLFTKTFFPREKLHIYRYKNLEVLTDHAAGDANGAREILTSPMYRRYLPQMKFDKPVNLLDLGANNGGFPLLLQTEGINLKKVVSVEFNPQTYSRLRFNLERNLDCQIAALNLAVCGESTTLEIKLGTGSVSNNIYEANVQGNSQTYQIKGETFDGICASHFSDEIIDLCKMDVEGAEFDVFRSSAHQNLTRCRYLIMEIHERPDRKADEILQILERLGFRLENQPGADQVYFFSNHLLA